MDKITTIIGWMLALVLVYLLVFNYKGTTSIISSSTSGGATLLKTLQARA